MSNSAIIILCIAVLVLPVILTLFISLRSKSSAQISALKATVDERDAAISALRQENESCSARLQQTLTENARLEARQQFIEKEAARIETERAEERRQMALENERERQRLAAESEQRFKLLARDILDSNTRDFKQQSEQRLCDLLNPLKEELDRFKKSVSDAYSNEARERFALSERIKELVQLNETIGREAKDLTRALRGDSKIQGDWGEMILETLLEKSGLKKGIHFDLQLTTDADGNTLKGSDGKNLRPDAVIYYPDGRCVIIDSKVSLTNYVELINSEQGSNAYNDAANGHLRSVKQHIKELATKNYQDFIGDKRADFVTMFIPNEGAYMAAMNLEPQLWQEAYDQRVLIVSPTHLLSFLRLAEQMWRQDDMKRNVLEIATESGKMYDKFVGFIDDMAKIEKGLAAAGNAYKEAMGKLVEGRGNLVRRAEKLRTMGAKTSKSISAGLAAKALPDTAEDED